MVNEGTRFVEYMQEHIIRMGLEQPSGGGSPFLAWAQSALPDDVRIAPLPGGALGILAGFFEWMRARYPHEVEACIQEYCRDMGVADEATLFARLKQETRGASEG
jgi:hypothetical protein